MPVEFLCPGCRATLSVARRKIGTETVCPRCAAELVVPDEFSGRTEVVMARLERSARKERREHTRPDLSVHGQDRGPAGPHGEVPAPWPDVSETYDDAPPIVVAEPPPVALWRPDAKPHDDSRSSTYALRSRRSHGWIAQAGLVVAVAAIAFVIGFAVGRSQHLHDGTAKPVDNTPVLLEGRVTYQDEAGAPRGDEGALVILLPLTPPEVKLRPLSLRGVDAAVADADAEQFARAEGATAKADENGSFTVVVPKSGEYHILWVSRHLNRPDEEMPAAGDLLALEAYFQSPIELIGLKKYVLARQMLDAQTKRLDHRFR